MGIFSNAPLVELTSRFATRDRALDLSSPGKVEPLPAGSRDFYTAPTELMPTDGIVQQTAREIIQGRRTDLEKARAIYEWIVENTFRDPKTRAAAWATSRRCWRRRTSAASAPT